MTVAEPRTAPPHDLEAEESVLGAALLNPRAYDDAANAGLTATGISQITRVSAAEYNERAGRCANSPGSWSAPLSTERGTNE